MTIDGNLLMLQITSKQRYFCPVILRNCNWNNSPPCNVQSSCKS